MPRKRKSKLKTVRNIIRRQAVTRAPSVHAVEPEVRTDMTITVTPGDNVRDRDTRIGKGELLGVYIVEWGYDVDEGQWDNFHKWLAKNEQRLASTCPGGVAYKGTYLAVFGPTHRTDGRYSTFWALNALDGIQNFGTKGGREFQKLLKEFLSFRDTAGRTGFSQLYQIAAGTPAY